MLATLTCTRSDSLPAGDSYPPITLTVDVANNAASPQVNLAKVEGGGDPTPSTDEDPTVILTDVNLNINKSHQGNFTQGQTGAEYTIEVSNAGPSDSTGTVTVTDTLPAGLTATAINGPGWNCVLATLTCTRSDSLPAGDSYPPITLTVDVANNAASPQVNLAKVEGGGDPTPSTDEDPTVIIQQAVDVQITKTASPLVAAPGDIVTYTLTAKNNGPGTALNVVMTDPLPAGVTFDSADAPCALSGVTVSCAIGALDPGEEITRQIRVKVGPIAAPVADHDHLLDIQRVEAQIDLEAGQQRTISVNCPSGYFVSDGSVRIDHIDQGTGDWTAPQVLESRATSLGTWQGTVRNTATGRAQAKIFAVCVKQQTNPADGHTHNLTVSDQVTVSQSVLPGRREATLQCAPGQIAIQPGFISSAPANLVYSEPEGNGWKFALDVKAPSDVTFSIRCLTRQVTFTDGHTHDLRFEHLVQDFTIQPGQVNEAQLTCADGYKGIVADMDLDEGLVSLGNDPRPVTRAYKVYNPTDSPLNARFSLLCLGDRTGGPVVNSTTIVNTAHVSTTSRDTDPSNDSSSATITVNGNGDDPVPPVPPVKPAPNNPIATKIAGSDLILRGNRVIATIKCSGACYGKAKLVAAKTLKVGRKKVRKGTLLASGSFRFDSAGKRKLKLKINRVGRKVLRKKGKAVLKLSSGQKRLVRISR